MTLSILLGTYFLTFKDFIFTTEPVFLGLFVVGLFLALSLNLKIQRYLFISEVMVFIPFLLFLTPETVTVVIALVYLVFSKRNRIIRAAFSYLMYSFGTFLYYLMPIDFLKIPTFVFGALCLNLVMNYFFSPLEIKKELKPFFLSAILTLTLSIVISFAYIFPEIKVSNLIFLFLEYSLVSYVMIEYIKHYNVTLIEKIEYENLKNEHENLLELRKIIYSDKKDVNENLKELMKTICKVSGFNVALMSLFDKSSDRVVRVAHHGLREEDFKRAAKNPPKMSDVIKYFNKRFNVDEVYFIPNGVTLFDSSLIFLIPERNRFEYENAWQPEDLLLVPIEDEQSNIIGYISFDVPKSGLRPTSHDLKFLRFVSWIVYEFLKKTPYLKYWISDQNVYLKNISFPEFIRLCENIIESSYSSVLVRVDIDNFDKINFEKGPEYAETISDYIEKYFYEKFSSISVFYKLTGEEFIFLFSNISKMSAINYLDRMREDVKQKFPEVTLSVGISYSEEREKSLQELLRESKNALIVAKKSGGGRTMVL